MAQDALLTIACEKLSNNLSLGVLTLNRPQALNTLNLPLVQMVQKQLELWEKDDKICMILMRGAGDKSFCAGGDVKALYMKYLDEPNKGIEHAQTFFNAEYSLDEQIARSLTPIIVYGRGYSLGGGLGLFQGANFRVLAPDALLGVPEVLIGLYPDVGCSYYLPRLKGGLGAFLALTGLQISAIEAQFAGWSNYLVSTNSCDDLIRSLVDYPFENNHSIYPQIHLVLKKIAACESQASRLNTEIMRWCESYWHTPPKCPGDLQQMLDQLRVAAQGTPFEDGVHENLDYASPLSLWLAHSQLQVGQFLNLSQAFQSERAASLACLAGGDFHEGVRALLVDKDRAPNWKYPSLASLPSSL